MTDDEAVIAMVDANIQRDELLPSEKAFAYKMKLAAMKRQGCRHNLTSGQNDQKLSGSVSRDILADQVGESSKQIQRYIRFDIAEQTGESARNVQRYIRLTELIPAFYL